MDKTNEHRLAILFIKQMIHDNVLMTRAHEHGAHKTIFITHIDEEKRSIRFEYLNYQRQVCTDEDTYTDDALSVKEGAIVNDHAGVEYRNDILI